MTYSNKPNRKSTWATLAMFLLAFSTIFVVACGDDDEPEPVVLPTAGFTSSANQLTVAFTNTSTDADSYSWDFGDGNGSTDASPTHIYTAEGTFTVTLTASNDDGEDTSSETVTVEALVEMPTASFTFEVDALVVTLTNTSVGGITYDWDFGDDNSSTDVSPTHTYAEGGTYTITLTAMNSEGSDIATESVSVEATRLTSGFVIMGITDDNTRFATHYEAIPTGTVDLSQGTSFQRFFTLSVVDGALIAARTDGSSGFERIIINGDKQFVEDGTIATISETSFQIRARNADIGVFHDRNSADIVQTFNPTTMEVTGVLDMSLANAAVSGEPVRYQQFIFRDDNEFVAPMRTEGGGDIIDAALPIVSISGAGVSEVAMFEGLGAVTYFNGSRNLVDEDGNLYIWHAGNLSVPTVPGSILKIPAGQYDYDPDYNFKVAEVNNPALTGFGGFMTGFEYWKDNKGFALVNESIDQGLVDLITERGGIQNFSQDDFNTALALLFNSPTGAFVMVDLETQSVTKVNGLPAVSVFAQGSATFILDGEPYFGFVTPTENALYSYDATSNTATKVFDATGISLADIVSLSENF